MSLRAVTPPTPGTPGMLSDESPMSARMSMIWRGSAMPHSSRKAGMPMMSNSLPFLPGLQKEQWGESSWPRSLSAETM